MRGRVGAPELSQAGVAADAAVPRVANGILAVVVLVVLLGEVEGAGLDDLGADGHAKLLGHALAQRLGEPALLGRAHEDGAAVPRQQYRGGRYSWGYPACPDLEDNERVAHLLEADRIGVTVNAQTGYQYQPEQTTSALIAHHPQAKYFVARAAKESRGFGVVEESTGAGIGEA